MTRGLAIAAAALVVAGLAAPSSRSSGEGLRLRHGKCGLTDNPAQGKLSRTRVDVDGDGNVDTVLVNPLAKPCPTLSVQYHDGPRVSLELKQFGLESGFPQFGFPPRVVRVVDLGADAGSAIIVQTFRSNSDAFAVVLAGRARLTRLGLPFQVGQGNSFFLYSFGTYSSGVGCWKPGELAYVRSHGNRSYVTALRVKADRAVIVGHLHVKSSTLPVLMDRQDRPFANCPRP
jgi:hypothetical protein